MTKLTLETVLVTPQMAKELLSNQIYPNRPLIQERVHFLAEQIKRGLWSESTGQNIKITDTGKLCDGQHRLHAIIKTGMPLQLEIRRGVPEVAVVNIDTGKSRTVGDAMRFLGVINGSRFASAIQLYENLRAGYTVLASVGSASNGGHGGVHNFSGGGVKYSTMAKSKKLTPTELAEKYFAEQDKWDGYLFAYKGGYSVVESAGNFIALLAFFSDYDADTARGFFSKLATGEGLEIGNPILTLRNRLILAKTSKSHYLTSSERYKAYVLSWNAVRKGRQMSKMAIPDGNISPL